MKFEPRHLRHDLRHPSYDYRAGGCYFVTICTKERQLIFGEVTDQQMIQNDLGRCVEESWRELPARFPGVSIEYPFVVMPNHVHMILMISEEGPRPRRHLGSVVGAFKGAATRRIQVLRPGLVVWQSNYYEHVVRTEEDLLTIGQYILDNPARWESDAHHPRRTGEDDLETHLRKAGRVVGGSFRLTGEPLA